MTKFEKQLHDMFDHIWDCEIDHPVFQDTVGELMSAVIQAYNNSAQPEIIRCKECKYFNPHVMECEGIGKWFGMEGVWGANDYCSKGERMAGDE